MDFFIFVLYFVCVIVFALWVVAWISIPFKLDRVNKNLEEIKELLSERPTKKKSQKTAG